MPDDATPGILCGNIRGSYEVGGINLKKIVELTYVKAPLETIRYHLIKSFNEIKNSRFHEKYQKD